MRPEADIAKALRDSAQVYQVDIEAITAQPVHWAGHARTQMQRERSFSLRIVDDQSWILGGILRNSLR